MKNCALILMVLIVILSGCGGKEEHKTELSMDDLALDQVNLYLKYPSNSSKIKDSAIEFIHDQRENLSNPTKFDELATYLEDGDLENAEKVYNELGGEHIESAEKTEQEKEDEQRDKFDGISNLYVARLFFDAGAGVSPEDRKQVAETIRHNMVFIKDESSVKFGELADHIENGDVSLAKSLYESLLKEYVPEAKLSEFNQMGDFSSPEEMEKAIDGILN